MVNLTDEMKKFVRRQKLGFVATVCPDGSPNLSPKGTTTVWDDNHLVFADIASPNTVRNLRTNPHVEINVVDPFVRKGYRFKGKAIVYSKGDQAFNTFMSLYKKSVQDAEQRIKSVVLVQVESAKPLVSPAYDFPVTEEEVNDKWKKYYNDLDPQTQTDTKLSD